MENHPRDQLRPSRGRKMKRRLTVMSLEGGPSKLSLGGVLLFVSPTHMWGQPPPAVRPSKARQFSHAIRKSELFNRVISSARLLSDPGS
jgi:hypothetical protein